jgi:2-methylcitrate dehydratase PrpD
VIGSNIITTAVNAALANGMLAHADETDDSHAPSLTHPGCGIISAALAMAERERRGGTALLRAVALGYDVSARLSLSLHAEAFRSFGHSTHSMAPTFGAAAAGAALARLNAKRVRYVLSYAAQQASGLSCYTSDRDHIEKAFDFGGLPARNGVAAATMVAAGCTGVANVFSGERNFFVAFDESAVLTRGLGEIYEIMNTNIKRWSVGSPIQAPSIRCASHPRAPNQSGRRREARGVGGAPGEYRGQPRYARYCIQHMCAIMVIDGKVTFASSHDQKRMRDRKCWRCAAACSTAMTRWWRCRNGKESSR